MEHTLISIVDDWTTLIGCYAPILSITEHPNTILLGCSEANDHKKSNCSCGLQIKLVQHSRQGEEEPLQQLVQGFLHERCDAEERDCGYLLQVSLSPYHRITGYNSQANQARSLAKPHRYVRHRQPTFRLVPPFSNFIVIDASVDIVDSMS